MRTSLVLTVIGPDRPGLVERLSDEVLDAGGNWEESRMARLAGKFAGLLRVSVDPARADALASRLAALATAGLTIVVEQSGAAPAAEARTARLELLGNDQPGIVRDIARALASHDINIEELETELTSAPMSGDTLFRARARLRIPAQASLADLRRVLEALAGELMVDVVVEDEPAQGSESP